MSNSIPSRNPPPANLAGVLELIIFDETLDADRRDDIASGLRSFAKDLGRPLNELAAHPHTLLERPPGLMPGLSGLDVNALKRFKRRWDNEKSLVRAALRRVGIIVIARQ